MYHANMVGIVFPAQAGVILMRSPPEWGGWRIPRASGGDPRFDNQVFVLIRYSPRKRG